VSPGQRKKGVWLATLFALPFAASGIGMLLLSVLAHAVRLVAHAVLAAGGCHVAAGATGDQPGQQIHHLPCHGALPV